jgi:predicted metal-dependent peptidase
MHIDQQATARVLKARSELIMSRRFYGVLVTNVEPVLSRNVKTMATDSKRHFYNPDFIATLTQTQMLAIQAHESEHDARHHSTRRAGRDHEKWNEACDFAINIDLKDEGFDLPDWVLIDAKYRGMSAEDIYRSRELDEKPQPQPQEDSDEQSSESDDDAGDEAKDDCDDEQGADGRQGDEGEGSDDDGDEQGEAESEHGGSSSGDGDDADDQGEGSGGNGEAKPGSCDPGMCGEVLDAPADADASDLDAQWERTVRQAASMAKAVGQLPGHVAREIERANTPGQDWRETLRAWFDQGGLRTETWNRPNRRFIGRGLILPGSQRDGVNKAIFVIDTSGSMDTVALACINAEAQAALDDGAIDEIVAVYGDTRVTRVDTYRTGDEIEFDPRGCGGTDLRPLFEHVADEHDDASLIVCFTDLYIGDAGPEPHCPVLFAVTGYPDAVRRLIASAPWGAPGIDVGAH